jgi:hypothetical protein
MFLLYVLAPIDDWSGWTVADDYMATLDGHEKAIFLETLRPAQSLIRSSPLFEPETHTYPWYIAPLPKSNFDTDGYCEWMVATKITNNGTTFLVSPYTLDWLGMADGVRL